MTPLAIGFTGIGALLVLMALRVPVGIALGGVSIIGIWVLRSSKAMVGSLSILPYDFVAHWSLSAVPMFLLMGAIVFHTGMTGKLFNVARLWLSFLPGGLAVATNLASAGFAAASGSSMATAAAMGRLAIPEMLKYNYEKGLATAVVAASGTLGSLIPPSILMVLYGIFTEQPIGKLLIAGILPGLLTAFVYTLLIVGRCMINPSLAPKYDGDDITWEERFSSLLTIWPIPILVVGVIASIYMGVATPTEAGAIGASLALVIGLFQGRLTWTVLKDSIKETLHSTASIFFVAVGAILLTRFLLLAGVPRYLAGLMGDWALDPLWLVIGSSLMFIVLGMFLDAIGLMLLALPILLPMYEELGLNLIWMGVLVIKYLEIGMITPPVGLNAYVVKGVVGDTASLPTIFKGLLWFMAAEVLIVGLLIAFPEISLYLPSLMED